MPFLPAKSLKLKKFALHEDKKNGYERDKHQSHYDYPVPTCTRSRQFHVHSVETGHQCRRHEKQRHKGEDFHDFVLVQVDDTDDGVLEKLYTLKTEIGMIYQ